jgi:hypothetical protein
MKIYEFYSAITGELLVGNMTFDEVPELYNAYTELFPEEDIIVGYREEPEIKRCAKIISIDEHERNCFRSDWFDLIEELVKMDNIY